MTNDKFRSALDMDFGDLDIKSKQELGVLMQRRKYLTGSDENKRQNQLDGAWEHLISVWGKQDVEFIRVKTREHLVIPKGRIKEGEGFKFGFVMRRGSRYPITRDAKGRFVKFGELNMGGWILTYENDKIRIWDCAICNNPKHNLMEMKI